MAKFTPGPTVAAVSGSVGGTVFSHNRYGQYMRFRAIPTISTTQYAMAAKASFTAASQAFQDLSTSEKLAWETWARTNPVSDRLGNQQVLTGHASFVGMHCRASVYGATPLSEPPTDPAPAPLTSISLTADIGIGNVEIAFTVTPTGANDHLWIDAAVTDSKGITYVANLLRHIHESPGAAASPYVIEAFVTGRFGALQVGQTLHVRVGVFNHTTMQLSAPLVDSVVVTST